MKKTVLFLIFLTITAGLCACGGCVKGGKNAMDTEIGGKTYVWEKPGAGGDFSIILRKDGTFQYYAGFLSSYIGNGTWEAEKGIVTLSEKSTYVDNVFRFEVKNGGLAFIADGSNKFMYVTVEDGDMFLAKKDDQDVFPAVPTGSAASFTHITQEEAKLMMAKDDGHIIVDVRRQDEYDEGHIPGAVLIPNESIGTERPEELPDTDQIILVYCRSGRRSREAAQKLFEMGYTNIYEFGGIIDWSGDIVKGGENDYGTENCVLVIKAGDKSFYAAFEDNTSAKALIEKLNSGEITVNMHDYGSFEKVGTLPWTLPRNDTQITTVPGDIILYQGNQITIYYDENSWSFTKLAHIGGATKQALLSVLGEGNVSVTLSLEWTE